MRTLRDASLLAEHQLAAIAQLTDVLHRCGGALLADQPGLGKSYIAAALAANAQRSGSAVELIVPASLIAQWKETLRGFEVEARVVSHDSLIGDPTVPAPGPRLMIVDEAHAFRNPATQRYAALARRSAGARVLLVTATPVCNSARDLESLLRLIVFDDVLAGRGVSSIDHAFAARDRELLGRVIHELVVRRGRSVLPDTLRFGDLERTIVRHRPCLPADLIDSLMFPFVSDAALLRQFLWRRLESSEAALLESLRRQRRFYERALECLAAGRTLSKRDYRRAFMHEEDASAVQTVLFWDVFVGGESAAGADEIEAELARLATLAARVEDRQSCLSPKTQQLIEISTTTEEPILIFTGWAATAIAIYDALRKLRRVALVTGRERTRAYDSIRAFCAGQIDVLVSTDLAAEGLNLQRAGMVVHYDLPWNPVKLEQREGRAHRIGQQRPVVRSIVFVPDDDHAGVVQTIVAKTRVRKRLLSGGGGQAIVPVRSSSLRPRISRDAAIIPFVTSAEAAGFLVPEPLLRRHKAGIEALLATMSVEHLDEARLRDLEALLSQEPWALSRPFRFANL